jgi:hypothetical protein
LKASTPRLGPGATVQADWLGWLPEAKMRAFRVYAEEFEARYLMLSVSLNEAIALRNHGAQSKSYQVVLITPPLCERLTGSLEGMLWSLGEHVTRYGVIPSVEPLDAANFHRQRGQRSARKSSLLSTVLLSKRAQYLNKVGTLREMVGYMSADFCHAAEQLLCTRGTSKPAILWAAMDEGQFDLNSCLRESMILLKCFLRVLPNHQLHAFQRTVSTHMAMINPKAPCCEDYQTPVQAAGHCSAATVGRPRD